jgi:hypothetical protein
MPKAQRQPATFTQALTAYAAFNLATKGQRDYLEILLNDAGYGQRARRNDWLSLRTHRNIHYLDELTKVECMRLISELQGDIESEQRPEAGRVLCSECEGQGTVCRVCGHTRRDCLDWREALEKAGKDVHEWEGVKCGVCEGRRFEEEV